MPYLDIRGVEPADILRVLCRVRGGLTLDNATLQTMLQGAREEYLKAYTNHELQTGEILSLQCSHPVGKYQIGFSIQPVGRMTENGRNLALSIDEVGIRSPGNYRKIPIHYMLASPALPVSEQEMSAIAQALETLQQGPQEDSVRARIGSRYSGSVR